jgi:hypothetical protein
LLAIEGAIQLIPHAIASDVGTLRVEDKTQPAIIQSFQTQSGVVQVIYPVEEIDRVIEGLNHAKEQSAKAEQSSSDLYIPPSADVGIKQAEEFQKLQDEIATPNK